MARFVPPSGPIRRQWLNPYRWRSLTNASREAQCGLSVARVAWRELVAQPALVRIEPLLTVWPAWRYEMNHYRRCEPCGGTKRTTKDGVAPVAVRIKPFAGVGRLWCWRVTVPRPRRRACRGTARSPWDPSATPDRWPYTPRFLGRARSLGRRSADNAAHSAPP